jgi:hypothetical protein
MSQTPIPLRGLWWGSQQHYAKWLPDLIKKVEPFAIWCESPSGSNTNSFVLQQLGKDVITNDASYYSHCIAKGVLGREGFDKFERDTASIQPVEGYCTKSGKYDAFPKETRMLIDGYAQLDNPYVKTVLGKTLATRCSYRSFDWDKKLMSKATPSVFQSWMSASHRLLSQYVNITRPGRLIKAYNVDWKEFIKIVDVKNAVLYSDFAWPWAPELGGGAGGPQLYRLYYDIDCILKQQDIDTSHLEVWTIENTHEKLAEYLKLVADSGKFKAFFLSHQDKDYPPKQEIDALLDMLGFKYDYSEYTVQVGFGSKPGQKSIMKEELWCIYLE